MGDPLSLRRLSCGVSRGGMAAAGCKRLFGGTDTAIVRSPSSFNHLDERSMQLASDTSFTPLLPMRLPRGPSI